jgi:hypothetical protein
MPPPIAILAGFAVGVAACSHQGDQTGAPTSEPSAVGALFEVSRDTDRGFERVREVVRHDTASVLRVETNYYGGALGGAAFGKDCLNRLCKKRGFAHWVILSHEVVRTGDLQAPGNDWSVTVGFMRSPVESSEVSTLFPEFAQANRAYQIHSVPSGPVATGPGSMLKSKDLWDVFSSIHFRFTK